MFDTLNELFGGGGDDARKIERMMLEAHPMSASLPIEPWLRTFRTLTTERVALVPPYLWSVR